METKTYFASSVPAALEVARQELGENALLIGSRPAPVEARRFGRLEVTFAWEPSGPAMGGREPAGVRDGDQTQDTEGSAMEDIRRQLSALRKAVGRSEPGRGGSLPESETLIEAGFTRETAAMIAAGAARRPGNPRTAAMREIAERIPVAPFVEMKPGESRTLAFIGPPGRGKTTSLVKIAVKLGLARRVPVRIYSAGAHAIGAQGQMARYAAILGTPFQACESLGSLNLALNGDGWKGLLLIDTPGISPADRGELDELQRFFAGRPEIEKHLVLRADSAMAEMSHMMARFAGLAPSRLLFTGLDEAARAASMIETLITRGVPASFCGTGQRIPEDLEDANADQLARAVFSGTVTEHSGREARFRQAAA
jgi:flagellar biosynthesis protein FlhF